MKYRITSLLQVNDWQALRVAIFGQALPVFEQYGVGTPYLVEFSEPVTPADLGPLIRVELLTNDNP
jgi:hypothetical protein